MRPAAWQLFGNIVLAASTAPPVDIEWVAPEQCPGRDAVIHEVLRILGDDAHPSERIVARAQVWRGEDRRWHVTLTSAGAGSEALSLDADSCQAAANATALIVALMVDPSRTVVASAPPPEATVIAPPSGPAEGGAAPPPASSARPAAPNPGEPPPRPAPLYVTPVVPAPAEKGAGSRGTNGARVRWAIGVAAGAAAGALSAPEPGAEIAVAWLTQRFRLEVAGASDWSSQHVPLAARTDEGADFRLLSGVARGCYSVLLSRLSLSGCAAFELDWLRASGFGANKTVSGTALLPAPGASALVTYGIDDRIALRVVLQGVAPLWRPPFVIIGLHEAVVEQPAAVWASAMLGAELHFF